MMEWDLRTRGLNLGAKGMLRKVSGMRLKYELKMTERILTEFFKKVLRGGHPNHAISVGYGRRSERRLKLAREFVGILTRSHLLISFRGTSRLLTFSGQKPAQGASVSDEGELW
jgi:hypothetical protein